ncbi:hypothetical protein [Nocardia concava]|uniref:hypothetical protein n=1 Tax=Nocardia concava TaxID=257281 RepID=UPI0012FABA92|nr:hypothetical protein [Nocardia concava]
MAVRRGEIRSYLPGVSGRDKSSSISGHRVVVISNDGANRAMSTALVLPILDRIDDDLAPNDQPGHYAESVCGIRRLRRRIAHALRHPFESF